MFGLFEKGEKKMKKLPMDEHLVSLKVELEDTLIKYSDIEKDFAVLTERSTELRMAFYKILNTSGNDSQSLIKILNAIELEAQVDHCLTFKNIALAIKEVAFYQTQHHSGLII